MKYGQTDEEREANELHKCREINSEINRYGITDAQRLRLIYLLSLELEDRTHLTQISSLIKDLEAGEKAVSTLIK